MANKESCMADKEGNNILHSCRNRYMCCFRTWFLAYRHRRFGCT